MRIGAGIVGSEGCWDGIFLTAGTVWGRWRKINKKKMNARGFVDIVLKNISDSYMEFCLTRAQVPGHIKPQWPQGGFVFETETHGTLQLI